MPPAKSAEGAVSQNRWLVTGASGQLGGHVVAHLLRSGAGPVQAWLGPSADASQMQQCLPGATLVRVDLHQPAATYQAVVDWRPTHVIHCAAMSAVGDCFARPIEADVINAQATAVLAGAAGARGARFVYTSTDMVFDGSAAPYHEASTPHPLSRYGWSKVSGEQALRFVPHALTVRIPLLYGVPVAPKTTTFVSQLNALRAGQALKLFTDEYRTPLWLEDAARALVALAQGELAGVIHVAGPERLSRCELIVRAAELLGLSTASILPISRLEIPSSEPRPADLSLAGSRFVSAFPHLAPRPLNREALA